MKRRCLMFVAAGMLLWPSMGVAATVVTGTVIEDKSGQPLPASVVVYKESSTGEWQFAGSRETDETGKYRFTHLEGGTYYLESRGYSNCDRKVDYCADKYLPQLYNNVAPWDFEQKTELVVKDGDVKELDAIKIKTRPFYFATIPNPCEPAGADGVVRITRKVANTTGHRQWMFFWGVVDSPFRTDPSDYYDMQASYAFGQGKWALLKPGMNTVTFTYKMTPAALEGRYNYWIIGGNSDLLPMTPYLSGTFCNGVSAEKSIADLASEDRAAGDEGSHGPLKPIPIRISADGKVLAKGPPGLQMGDLDRGRPCNSQP
jgi:hypothetical protein